MSDITRCFPLKNYSFKLKYCIRFIPNFNNFPVPASIVKCTSILPLYITSLVQCQCPFTYRMKVHLIILYSIVFGIYQLGCDRLVNYPTSVCMQYIRRTKRITSFIWRLVVGLLQLSFLVIKRLILYLTITFPTFQQVLMTKLKLKWSGKSLRLNTSNRSRGTISTKCAFRPWKRPIFTAMTDKDYFF